MDEQAKKRGKTGARRAIAARWMINSFSIVALLLVLANIIIYYFMRQYYYGSAENYVISEQPRRF